MPTSKEVIPSGAFSPERLALLAKMLQQEGVSLQQKNAIERRANLLEYPLSSGQQRLWFLQHMEGGCHYNDHFNLRLTGGVNVPALERSIQEILKRHEAMRARFTEVDGQPFQRIEPLQNFTLPVIDLRQLPAESRLTEATRLAVEEARKPFDLAAGPLWRFHLVALGDEDHLLLITAHHIGIDGWSRGVFLNEFCAIYKAFLLGRASPLSELPVQYTDYAAWQSEWLKCAEFTRQLDYWKQRLAGAPPLLELPCDRPRPPIQSFRGARHYFTLPKAITDKLRNLSRREKVTLFMTLLAGFQSLLHRYTGQEDVLIGTPVANRPQKEIQGLIGYFLNTVVLRGDCSGAPTFRQLLKRLRATSLEAFGNQDLPLEKLTDALQVERNQSHSPLFQVLFVLQNVPAPEVDIPGLSVQPFEIDNGTAKFDLTVSLFEVEDGLTGWLEYSTELFDGARMGRMVGHFQTVLEAIAVNPDQRLQELPLLTDAERQQVLVDWNRTQIDYPKDRCLHELIEEQVERTPEAVAVSFKEARLTYRQLNERANQLAHHLQKLAVGPDVLVGICMERSLELVIGLLGILKAGGAYVPLDPAYPAERLELVIEDARMGVLVTQGKCLEKLAKLPAHVLNLDDDRITIGTEVRENLPKACRAEDLAYVIYTSGSTGRPKGVAIEHRSPVAFVAWAHKVFTAKELAGVLFSTSVWFDLSIFELFVPLAQGGRVILAENALELAAVGPGNEVTLINTVPSAMAELVRTPRLPASVVTVNLAGEPLAASLVDKIYEQGSVQMVYDLYGPSETTTYSTFTLRSLGSRATIGRPIANTQIYLLDRQLQPVPIGVPAELHIGGVGLARGYLNRPELTAEKFIPHPFSSEPGARLYKTGDLARYLPDGNIEYLGRLDHQVKIRGFRIELGEIEAALKSHPGVRETVVLAREDTPGDKRLVAYVTAQNGAVSCSDLRAFLGQKLPDYMIPAAFASLEKLPLTPNGKIDRKALPAPDINRGGKVFAAPVTAVQKALGEAWKGLLRVDQVGLYDNFFDLGGHSLLAMQLIARVRNALKVEVILQQIFAAPTLIEMSQAVESAQGRSESTKMAVPRARPEGTSPRNESILPQGTSPFLAEALTGVELDRDRIVRVFPVSFAQQRLWFLEQLEPNTAVYNLAYTFRLRGALNLQALRLSLQSILDRHEPLRSVFAMIGADSVQVIQRSRPLEVALVDLSGFPANDRRAEAQKLAEVEARRPFDLSRDLMLRAKVLRLDAEEHLLLITMHHIVSDFWSVGILFREFAAAYEKYLKGMDGSLPAPVVQYADFAVWQRDYLRGELLGRQLKYWKQQLAGAPPLLALPTDRPRPALQTYAGAAASLHLSGELRDSLQELSRREGVTLFMTMLAAFEVVLHHYTQQDDIVVGSPIAGRNEVETEELIGLFVNTIVLRTDLSGDPSFKGLLGRVRDTALGAYAYQDLPFERLVEELQPERNRSYSPICQVLFSFQSPAVPALESAGLALSLEPVSTGTAKFDLALYITEQVDGVAIWAEYSTDLFESDTVSRLLEHYKTLLEAAVAHPDVPMSRLPLLTPGERKLMLEEWNQTTVDYTSTKCVHEMVEEQAVLFPERIAIEFAGRQMTYGELDRRATLLALHLQSLGVGPDSLVCLCLDRSLDLVVGLLGVLKAGGAYVPLDPAYPAERLEFILADARPKVLLSETQLLPALSGLKLGEQVGESPAIVCLDQLLKSGSEGPGHRPLERKVRPEDLAYVIYTSGSTGKPKGVQVEHRSVVNFLDSMRRTPGFSASDVLLAVTTLCFDIAGLEIFLPLTTGARVVIASRDLTVDGLQLARLLEESGVTVMQATPATWRLLIEASWKGNPNFKVLCGGEAWTQELAEALLVRCGSLWNMYGPTETTIWSAACEVTRGQQVLIGFPIANTQFYVLDKSLQSVPVGVPGELHIGGHGVARGYANRPELTAEKFICDPFASTPGARLYKTGDLVRYRADGKIEYLARMDHQVKVRGFRIELGEIESALAANPGLRETVVVVREDRADEKQLVAYAVAAVQPAPTTAELRQYLLKKVPDYMVPSFFVLLPALPRLPNGKIDRKALPAPDLNLGGKLRAAPITALQKALGEAWEGLLRVEQVGLYDNFFDLGGHSLLAMQLIERVRSVLKVELTLQQFFSAPTLIEMSQAVEAAQGRSECPLTEGISPQVESPFLASALTSVEIDRALISRVFPISLAQQRLWFLEQLEPNTAVYNLAYALRLRGSLNVQAVMRSLQSILHRHEALRSVFGMVGADPVQIIRRSCTLEVPKVDLSGLPPVVRKAEAQKMAETEARQPFDLARDLMLRAKLLRLDDQEHLLLITMHHIVSDFWSVGVLFREFATAYERYLKGIDENPPAPAVQYADFAVWQRDHLRAEVLERQLMYWKQQLAGAPPLLALPTDRPRPALQTYAGSVVLLYLSRELKDSLQELSRREGVTLFMTLLAAFDVLLHRYAGQDDIVVGSPIAGRNQVETEGLIGFFVNTIVLRTDLSGDPSFKTLLARVRDTALGAYAYQDLPFEKLVEELHPERNLSYNPLIQVLFSFQNPAVPPLESAGIKLNLEPVSTGAAKLDLALYITEQIDGIAVLAEYNTDLFERDTIGRLLEAYQGLLGAVLAEPNQRISALPLAASIKDRSKVSQTPPDASARAVSTGTTAKIAPQDELEQRLVRIWERVLRVRPIGVRDNFFDLGGHSLLAVRLFLEIKKAMKRDLPLATLFQGPTVEQLARLLRDTGWVAPSRSLVPIQPEGNKTPFFCVHGGGGNVLLFRDLSRHLGPEYPFYGIQSQGLDGRGEFITKIEDMATRYLDEIREVQPKGPYYLGGFCMGGSVAYEMAQQLIEKGQEVALLALFDTYNHNGKSPDRSLSEWMVYVGQKTRFHWLNISHLSSRQRSAYFETKIKEAVRRGVTRARIGVSNVFSRIHSKAHKRLSFLEDVNDRAAFAYRPRVYPQKLTFFKHHNNFSFLDAPQMGWANLAVDGLDVIEVPASPGGMFVEPYVQIVAAKLRACLENAQPHSRSEDRIPMAEHFGA